MLDDTKLFINEICSFENNLTKIGIENEQILMLLLKVNKSTTISKKSLVGFSFPATMIKIKENKEKGDLTR